MIDRVLTDAAQRWAAGREAHGGGPWVGKHPLEELYEELCDALNYLAEHEHREGESAGSAMLRTTLMNAAVIVLTRHDFDLAL